jgi:DNA mismatch repair protein MutL
MAGKIRVLPSFVAEKVAAGEVIQRPGDVVKELVENAIDAIGEARAAHPDRAAKIGSIQVEVRGGGLDLIRVVDDGCGIPADDVVVALARHGTSKIRDLDDLGRVRTLGFRGEALPSIGAVAELSVLTRPYDAAVGAYVLVDGGERRDAAPRGCPLGTQVQVRRLFYNLPARLAFQRSPAGEAAHIAHLVGVYALAYPDLRFRLVVDGRRAIEATGGTLADALVAVYGAEAGTAALTVELVDPAGVAVRGVICGPHLTRGTRGDVTLFVNGRPVANRNLVHAVVDAYRGFLPDGRFPLVALNVELDPAEVDVNVHPSKADVRFRRDRLVYATLQRAVRGVLLAQGPMQVVSRPLEGAVAVPRPSHPPSGRPEPSQRPIPFAVEARPAPRLVEPPAGPSTDTGAAPVMTTGSRLPILRIVGQVQGTYIVCEGPDGVYFVDQHAAHERVLYEQVLAQRAAGGVARQQLLEPHAIELGGHRLALLEEHAAVVAQLGFEAEPFGDTTALLRAVPTGVKGGDGGRALADLLDALADPAPAAGGLDRAAATVACHAAVRAGDVLSPELMRQVIEQLEETDVGSFCPHGRPTVVRLPVSQLERDFGRR